ncbi:MAG: glycoside hydrolase domain-containing protein [Candidatus Acidiferrales bacterium]
MRKLRIDSRNFSQALPALLMAVFCLALLPVHGSQLQRKLTSSNASPPSSTYLGFDANDYPGDAPALSLKKKFSFAGYWLNNPPGASANSWSGRRAILREAGFGFLVLFNGRLDRELKNSAGPAALGANDARIGAASARREGFRSSVIIFLDLEEGGRMLPEQNAYIFAWIDGIIAAGFRAGIYCSGMPASEGEGVSVITAVDIRSQAAGREIAFFVYNDACPPSPGCANPARPPKPSASGVPFASVWQFAQSPRRRAFTKHCSSTYSSDGNCYAPGSGPGSPFLDLDSATSPDPSHGRD